MRKHVVLWAVLLALGSCGAPAPSAPSVPAACTDGVKNGPETDVDCGGACHSCEAGKACTVTNDCKTGRCDSGVCAMMPLAPTCTDGKLSNGESDVDCGGSCGGCDVGKKCALANDCRSGRCDGGVCAMPVAPPTCMDGKLNGAESDIDCGGGMCASCADGKVCKGPLDCVSSICEGGRCVTVPVISSIAPDQGLTSGGAMVTIRGDGFVQGPGFAVSLGGRPVDMAQVFSRQRIDFILPATPGKTGKVDVVVKNPDGRQATKAQGFTYVSALRFAAAVRYPANPGSANPASFGITSADFNGDGKIDLANSNFNDGNVSVRFGNGKGTFQAPTIYATGTRWSSFLSAADLNGDGKADLVVPNQGYADFATRYVSIFLNAGDGTFRAPVNYRANLDPWTSAVGDLNGDGKPDLLIGNHTSWDVSVLLGKGDGTFQLAVQYALPNSAEHVALGDFNQDGKLDAASTVAGAGVAIFLGNGDGTLRNAVVHTTGAGSHGLAIADLNADGRLDVAANNSAPSSVAVLLGKGDGTFLPAVKYSIDAGPTDLAVADFDLDGVPDLTAASAAADAVSVLLGRGDGTFYFRQNFKTGIDPISTIVADFNGDRKPDLAASHLNGNDISILLNTLP